jgi:hypothetical protein
MELAGEERQALAEEAAARLTCAQDGRRGREGEAPRPWKW